MATLDEEKHLQQTSLQSVCKRDFSDIVGTVLLLLIILRIILYSSLTIPNVAKESGGVL